MEEVFIQMANDLLAYERFDIGGSYNQKAFKKAVRLRSISQSSDEEILEKQDLILSELNTLKNIYL